MVMVIVNTNVMLHILG